MAEIRAMIISGELLPGQKVHQGTLSQKLKVSRIPVREALSTLQAEGMVVHRPNTGFTVARFDRDDLAEIYLMRRLLETELLRTAELEMVDVDVLGALNTELHGLASVEDSGDFLALNRQFHFTIFESSPLTLVRQQVEQLWNKSEVFRTLYVSEPGVVERVEAEHREMIELVRNRDHEGLVALHDSHRNHTGQIIMHRLTRSRPKAARTRVGEV